MAKNKVQFIDNLSITDFAAEGKSLGRYNDKVIFVPHTAPGDVVNVRINKWQKNHGEGYVLSFVEKSPLRSEPACFHFGTCGGCKWQHVPYEEQLKFKQKQVVEQLRRIAKVELPEVLPILGCNNHFFYRNKLDFTFGTRRWLSNEEIASGEKQDFQGLGFHVPGRFDRIIDIEKCFLQPDPSNEIRNSLKRFCIEKNIAFFDAVSKTGQMRGLIIRNSPTTGDLMVIVQFFEDNHEQIFAVMNFLKENFPQITSLNYIHNPKMNDSYQDLTVNCFAGEPFITEKMEDLSFRIAPKSFYQTNSLQAYELYKVVRNFARLTGKEIVYDLYTGTGTIANFVAKQAEKVVGIEYVPDAVEDAKVNSRLNNLKNTLFFAGDMKDLLNESFIITHGQPDVIITDPPRAGMHEKVTQTIIKANPRRIVYVSCNPATQARDLQLLDEFYAVTDVQPVDMFPHTHHVENVLCLERRNT
jgi:23S rRNA (uracil1939-C5)-methyltransferase